MKAVWKWLLGVLAVLILLGMLAMPFMGGRLYPFGGCGCGMAGWGMPMMSGYGSFGYGMLAWGLIQFGLIILIALGIAWLMRDISRMDRRS